MKKTHNQHTSWQSEVSRALDGVNNDCVSSTFLCRNTSDNRPFIGSRVCYTEYWQLYIKLMFCPKDIKKCSLKVNYLAKVKY